MNVTAVNVQVEHSSSKQKKKMEKEKKYTTTLWAESARYLQCKSIRHTFTHTHINNCDP